MERNGRRWILHIAMDSDGYLPGIRGMDFNTWTWSLKELYRKVFTCLGSD